MLEHILAFQFGGFYGGDIGNLLAYWEQAGVFSYVLPFLLIFAVVFGILSRTKMFGEANKGLNAVVSVVIGLLALQFEFVPFFFSDIFPRLGIGLSVILVLMILVGMFLPEKNTSAVNYLLLGVAVIIFIVIITKSFGDLGFGTSNIGYFIYSNLPTITIIIIVMVAIGAIVGAGAPKTPEFSTPIWRSK
ncbi:MAG: hypothetical protein U1B79_01195 [Candidatus Pacearchaeota archaeon]|nr:hypothetical protein [Nanoarchaeota archaeon]MDZ4226706.1 hypothetical protein [Candidatus Pacearchaeota archaeon]